MLLADLIRDEYAEPLEPPPPPRDPLTFARSLKNPKGEFAGQPYEPALHPGQLVFWVVYALCGFRNWALAADAQSGKSWLIQVMLFYHTCELRRDVLYGLPDMRFASDVWHAKIKEAMTLSGLEDRLPDSGSGSGGGADIDTVYLRRAGSINFHGANGKLGGGGNDGRTIPTIINDEFDSLPTPIIAKNEHRADSYFRIARRFRTSTVKDDESSNILQAYDNSTRGRICYRCPHCQGWTTLDFERFTADTTSDESAEASARLSCLACDALIDEEQRQAMLIEPRLILDGQQMDSAGEIIGDGAQAVMVRAVNQVVAQLSGSTRDAERVIAAAPRFPVPPGPVTFGLRWCRFDNPFKPMGETAQSYRDALVKEQAGNSKTLIDFYHEVLARQYPRPKRDEDTDPARLALRSAESTCERNEVPAEAVFLTANIDQQKRLLLWLVKAHDRQGRTWRVAWGQEDICGQRVEPTPGQRIEALDRVHAHLAAGFERVGHGRVLIPVIIGLDVADWPDLVAEWARSHADVLPTHGTGREQVERMKRGDGKRLKMLEGWYDLREQASHGGTWRILWLDTDAVKHELSRSLARPVNAPASAMLPAGLNQQSDLIMHLTSERWQKHPKTGRMCWHKVGPYNDLWDCDYVTQALGMYFITENPGYEEPNPDAAGTPPEPDRGGWGGGLGWA